MSHNIGTEEDPVLVFVNYGGGILDVVIRADDHETFMDAAIYAELYYEVIAKSVDEETGEQVLTPTGEYALSVGIDIDPLSPVVITPAVYDEDGVTVLTEAVTDPRPHYNVRMTAPSTQRVDEYGVLKWHKWAMAWTFGGDVDEDQNANEDARTMYGVSLIDRDTINSPARVWL